SNTKDDYKNNRVKRPRRLSSEVASSALGWLLEEIHVTWAHLEKKQTRLQLYTKSDKENAYSGWRLRLN
ncbi:hypothetical protein Tco_1332976, partial [Tanacetum coccineum]